MISHTVEQTTLEIESKIIRREYNGRVYLDWVNTTRPLKSFTKGKEDSLIDEYEDFFKRLESEGFDVYEKWRKLQFKDVPGIKPVANRWRDGTWRRAYQNLPSEKYGQTHYVCKGHFETLYDAFVEGYTELEELARNYQQQKDAERKQKEEEDYLFKLKNMDNDELISLVLNVTKKNDDLTNNLKQSKKDIRQLKHERDEAEALAEVVTTGLYREYLECPVCGGDMRKMYSHKTGEYFVGCSDYRLDPKSHKGATKPFDSVARALLKQGLLF